MVLPNAEEPVSFEKHIQTPFRERNHQSVKFAFDPWSHDDVKQNTQAILDHVREGSRP